MTFNSFRSFVFSAFCFFLLYTACQPAPQPLVPAFYHWQTRLDLTPAETAYLDALRCRRLYLKFLDIGKDPQTGEIRPYSLLEVQDTAGLAGKTLIPCVFITNSVFQHISAEKIDWLAGKTAAALAELGRQLPGAHFAEVQFDCDWTGGTRDAFFTFLKKIKTQLPRDTRIGVTIRLHQYKFPHQTGVPPAERGMLMLYNTGDIDRWETGNSIFDPEAARVYLDGAPARYPLPLDLALPVFSWALVYRDDALWKIVPDPAENEFRDSSRFEVRSSKFDHGASAQGPERTGKGGDLSARFEVRRNTYLAGHYLRTGDLIRVERVDTALLYEAARLGARIPLAPGAALAFYHLDTGVVRQYPVKCLKTVCETINRLR